MSSKTQTGRVFTIQDELVQILMDLGLTLLQAKIYLTLSQTGTATIRTISKTSNIARQDIYRILPTLQKLGLAEKILAAPIMYKATPMKDGLSILLQNKTKEHIELQKNTVELLNNVHTIKDETAFQDENQQFSIVSSETLLFRRHAQKENIVQKSIDVVGEFRGIRFMLFHRLQDLKRAANRGVRIRIITENHEENKAIQKSVQSLKTNPLFGIRYLSKPIPVKTVIHDGTEVNMCIAISPDNIVPSLWSNNPQFVKIMAAYFEELWNKAVDAPEILTRKSKRLKRLHTRSAQPVSR